MSLATLANDHSSLIVTCSVWTAMVWAPMHFSLLSLKTSGREVSFAVTGFLFPGWAIFLGLEHCALRICTMTGFCFDGTGILSNRLRCFINCRSCLSSSCWPAFGVVSLSNGSGGLVVDFGAVVFFTSRGLPQQKMAQHKNRSFEPPRK